MLFGCLVVPVLWGGLVLFGMSIGVQFLKKHPEIDELRHCLIRLERIEWRRDRAKQRELKQRDALEVYVAGRFRKTELRRGVLGLNLHQQRSGKAADLTGEDLRTACRSLVEEIRKGGRKG